MGKFDDFDGGVEGQLTIEDLFTPPEKLIAVSRVFARARKEMSLAEQKTFIYALSSFKFTEEAKTDVVYLDKKTLGKITGIKANSDHFSGNLFKQIRDLPRHSFVEFRDEDKKLFDSGTMITRVTMLKNRVRIKFESEYLKLFTGLSTEYITMWSSDIFQMQSIRSLQFYEYLRQCTDTRLDVNNVGLGVRAIKDMLGIPKDGSGSYVKDNGSFDRTNFEKYVIGQVCEDLRKCKMITLVVQPDGKYYEKVKQGNRVLGYRFYWTFSAHPAVATAEEVKQIQERVDKDPEVLKVAKDILKGKKRENTKAQKTLHNYMERDPESNVDLYEQIARMDAQRMQTEDD